MFQNTQNVTKKDFANVAYSSILGVVGDPEHNIRPAGYTEEPLIFFALCVTGTGNNNCLVRWCAYCDISLKSVHTGTSGLPTRASRFSWVLKNITVGSVYPAARLDSSLVINEGETKVILEVSVYKGACRKDYDRDYFKLFFARISAVFSPSGCPVLMNHFIIYTPKPGTFDPNNPPK